MKHLRRFTALLLCIALVLCLFGCDTPEEATEPTATQPEVTEPPVTEPQADAVYADARAPLDHAQALTLALTVNTTTIVADQVFSQLSQQTLSYAGIGTEQMQVSMAEEIAYNVHEPDEDASEDGEANFMSYTEVYADGTLYIELHDTFKFSAAITPEDCAARYYPAVLLDAALYGVMTAETTDEGISISFSEPSAAESWAIPEEAELIHAQGSALVDDSGALTRMTYTVTYQYGPAEITLDVVSEPQAAAEAITLPETPDGYTVLQYPDAARTYINAAGMLAQAESVTASSLESVFSQAAGVVRNQSTIMDVHGHSEDIMTKIETSIYLMDYSTNQEQRYEQREIYLNGKYELTVDNGVPTSQVGVSYEDVSEYCYTVMISHLSDPQFWQDAALTDLGSLYLVEYTYTEDFGNTMQNAICNMFWEDAGFLNKLSSAYVNNETTGYISFDKYTGIPTAAGYYYEGTHTIDGFDYTLSLQSDQSIEAPSLGAYFEITEEMPPEEEPETLPTPLFYHVTGEDGQEMWLLGTIHVGDEHTAYLPQEIKDAFAASDALALECDTRAFDEQLENDDDLQEQVSDEYYYSNGKTIESMMEEEQYALAVKFMKATGNYNMNAPYMKPYLWSSSIDNFYLRQGYQLHRDQGVEARLHAWAEEQEKEIREIESNLFQIRMLTGYSDELQLLMLEESMEYSARESWENTWELYEKWCAGDEAALREAINEDVDTSEFTEEEMAEYEAELPLIEEYHKAMSYDRNEGMLKVAITYLESGEVVFYAVGLAHLLDDTNGLVDALRDAGYTVELVQYAR